MSNSLFCEESNFQYLEITDEILDGIFPPEEVGKVTTPDKEELVSANYDTDFDKDSLFQETIKDFLKADREHFALLHHLVQLYLPYATPQCSAIFIIIFTIICMIVSSFDDC
eukprot:GFUD01001838.1.p1 GENE.GFUD01001838.1~~GFUD01001838.1.p1  ORF type:complete len:112 (+),score=23.93 GFUD01001838.1:177-512(+)